MDSEVGTIIQCVGIVLITLLCAFMSRSIRTVSLKYWTIAWSCLSIALLSLRIGFDASALQKFFYSIYSLGEYGFGYMLIAGCRNYASGGRLTRRHLFALAPAVLVAFLLPHISDDFNDQFTVQAFLMAGFSPPHTWRCALRAVETERVRDCA